MCQICKGELWVCENHPDKPWNKDGCMCGAGDPCRCNRVDPPDMPPGFRPVTDRDRGSFH